MAIMTNLSMISHHQEYIASIIIASIMIFCIVFLTQKRKNGQF